MKKIRLFHSFQGYSTSTRWWADEVFYSSEIEWECSTLQPVVESNWKRISRWIKWHLKMRDKDSFYHLFRYKNLAFNSSSTAIERIRIGIENCHQFNCDLAIKLRYSCTRLQNKRSRKQLIKFHIIKIFNFATKRSSKARCGLVSLRRWSPVVKIWSERKKLICVSHRLQCRAKHMISPSAESTIEWIIDRNRYKNK